MTWYADPSGATERCELRCATLRVQEGCCPNLLAEAALYRYSDDAGNRRAEAPVDEHNHALAALCYLVSRLDARQMARNRGQTGGGDPTANPPPAPRKKRPWLRLDNEALWTPL